MRYHLVVEINVAVVELRVETVFYLVWGTTLLPHSLCLYRSFINNIVYLKLFLLNGVLSWYKLLTTWT